MLFLHVRKLVLHLLKIQVMEILRECTPLTDNDCFMIFSRKKKSFDFPLHTHYEMELNLVMNAEGASRVVGNHYGTIGNIELVLVSGDTPHAWFTENCKSEEIYEITLQFSPNLFDEKFMNRNPMAALKQLFEDARRGVLFSPEVAVQVASMLEALYDQGGGRWYEANFGHVDNSEFIVNLQRPPASFRQLLRRQVNKFPLHKTGGGSQLSQ